MKIWLASVALLLAACGAKQERPHVRLGVLGVGLQTMQMPVTLAQMLGYYKDEGVEVTLENMTTYPKALEALVGGSVDVASISYTQAVLMAARGQHIRTFFNGVNANSVILLVAPKALGKIRRIEDMNGMVLGVPAPGSPTNQWINAALIHHGLAPSDVKTVAIGTGAAAIAAFESGRIDAAGVGGGDHIRILRRNPSARIVLDTSTPEGLRGCGADSIAAGAVAATQEWLDRNPDTARRLDRALLRSLQWIATKSSEEIYAKLPDNLRSSDTAIDLDVIRWSLPQFNTDGRMPKAAPESTMRFVNTVMENVRGTKIDLASTWTNEYLPEAK